MSLLTEAMENCIMLDRHTEADGYGGYKTTWTEGAPFQAAIVLDSSLEAVTALSQGVTAIYTITTTKALNLQYYDVFKRISDGKVFRVKSDGDDKKTPASAGLNMRQIRAEEWALPS